MAPHSSTLAWKIPWTAELPRLQSMGSLRVGHDWATSLSVLTFIHWSRKWLPTPVFLPGESQGQGSLMGCVYGVAQSRTRLKRLSSSRSSSNLLSFILTSLICSELIFVNDNVNIHILLSMISPFINVNFVSLVIFDIISVVCEVSLLECGFEASYFKLLNSTFFINSFINYHKVFILCIYFPFSTWQTLYLGGNYKVSDLMFVSPQNSYVEGPDKVLKIQWNYKIWAHIY